MAESIKFEASLWSIVYIGNRTFLGKRVDSDVGPCLSPVYEIKSVDLPMQTPQGFALQYIRQIVPVLGMLSPITMHIRTYDAIIAVSDLSDTDLDDLDQQYGAMHQQLLQRRLQHSNIVSATSLDGIKGGPIVGHS